MRLTSTPQLFTLQNQIKQQKLEKFLICSFFYFELEKLLNPDLKFHAHGIHSEIAHLDSGKSEQMLKLQLEIRNWGFLVRLGRRKKSYLESVVADENLFPLLLLLEHDERLLDAGDDPQGDVRRLACKVVDCQIQAQYWLISRLERALCAPQWPKFLLAITPTRSDHHSTSLDPQYVG